MVQMVRIRTQSGPAKKTTDICGSLLHCGPTLSDIQQGGAADFFTLCFTLWRSSDLATPAMHPSRRRFLTRAGKALGGLALIQAVPGWTFATRSPSADLVHRSTETMGTTIRLSLLKEEFSAAAASGPLLRLKEVNDLLTVHDSSSALMRMNNGNRVTVKELADVTRSALQFGERSEGAMDVTVLPAMRRLGFLPGATMKGSIDFRQIALDGDTVSICSGDMGVDFGGIAKGYGVDQAITLTRAAGVSAALIDAGGDLFALGRPEADRRWMIGIRHPERAGDLVATLELEDEAVATSGTYLHKRTVGGRSVSHIIDPRTGTSVDHVVSATIVAGDTMTADALATSVSVTSRSQGQALIASQEGVEGFLIYKDGTTFTSAGLERRLRIL